MKLNVAEKDDIPLILIVSILIHLGFNGMLLQLLGERPGTTEYRAIAENLVRGNGFVMEAGGPPMLWRPPLYIFLLAGIYPLFGVRYVPVLFVQILLNSLTCCLAYILSKDIFDRQVGLLTAFLLALHPLFLYNSARVMTEVLFTFLLVVSTLSILWFAKTLQGRYAILCGIFVGLTTLCRSSWQYFPLFLVPVLGLLHKKRHGAALVLKKSWIVVAGMVLMVAPWTIRNYVASGGEFIFVTTDAGYALWVGNHLPTRGLDDDALSEEGLQTLRRDMAAVLSVDPDPKMLEKIFEISWESKKNSDRLVREALREMWAHPFQTGALWIKKIFHFWFFYMGQRAEMVQIPILLIQAGVLVPALIGLYFSWTQPRRPFLLVPIAVVGYHLLLHVVTLANVRYSTPLLPYVTMLASYGIQGLRRWGRVKDLPHPIFQNL